MTKLHGGKIGGGNNNKQLGLLTFLQANVRKLFFLEINKNIIHV